MVDQTGMVSLLQAAGVEKLQTPGYCTILQYLLNLVGAIWALLGPSGAASACGCAVQGAAQQTHSAAVSVVQEACGGRCRKQTAATANPNLCRALQAAQESLRQKQRGGSRELAAPKCKVSLYWLGTLQWATGAEGLPRTSAGMLRTSAESCVMTALQSHCRGPAETVLHCLQRAVKDTGQLRRQQRVSPCGNGTA